MCLPDTAEARFRQGHNSDRPGKQGMLPRSFALGED